jgi:protein-disulfide isomerase
MSTPTPSPKSNRPARRAERKQAAIATRQRQQRQKFIILGVLGAVVIAAVLIFLNQPDDKEPIDIDFATLPQTGAVLGNPDATVQIVEYADYQCPFCAQFATDVVPRIINDYVEPGLVTYEFRAFPFLGDAELDSADNESVQAAEAAACAMDQGKFWEYNHILFENHDGENDGAFASDRLKGFAGDLGLDQATFDDCLDAGTHQQNVLDAFAAAQGEGIDSTPTIIINGQVIQYTTQGYDLLRRQIDAAIAGDEIPIS